MSYNRHSNIVTQSYVEIIGKVVDTPKRMEDGKHMFHVDVVRRNTDRKEIDTVPVVVGNIYSSLPKVGTYVSVSGEIGSTNVNKKLLMYVDARIVCVFSRNTRHRKEEVSRFVNTNLATFTGRIVDKKELHQTRGGKDVLTIIVARENEDGSNVYIPVVTWWKTARFLDNVKIGTLVGVRGTFQTRKYYTDINGKHVENTAYEVSAKVVDVIRDREE